MNRRKVIFSFLLLGGGLASTYSGFKWYQLTKTPDYIFLDEHKDLLADLAEIIIPRTNTPGAKDAMAHEVIINLVKNISDRKNQNNFIDGLKDIENYAINKFGKKFTTLQANQQRAIVLHFQKKGKNDFGKLVKVKNKILGKSFFELLKYYTTIAFCTSERGATETLAYSYVPGSYKACTNLSPGQKSWATK